MYEDFSNLIGCRIVTMAIDSDEVRFTAQSPNDDTLYTCAFFHPQDCCESVSIHAQNHHSGDSLIGAVIKSVSLYSNGLDDADESGTRTELRIEYVTIGDYIESDTATLEVVWHGYSNGYYGEGISASITTDGTRKRW